MTRPLRLDISGSLYHVTARGIRRDAIFRSDNDRLTWLSIMSETCARFHFAVRSYCQMGNHYHLLLETVDGALSQGMRYLNGSYSQYFNRTHGLVGHVFQGRYKAILCQSERYLLELSRYIELNPVRAGMVAHPAQWLWSSHRATMGLQDAPEWLRSDAVLVRFGSDRHNARAQYEQFVLAGIGGPNPLATVSKQLLLGDDDFCASVHGAPVKGDTLQLARTQRKAIALPLPGYFSEYRNSKEAMARAYLSLAYSMQEIARHAGVSTRTVSRAIKAFRNGELTP